MKLLAVVCVLLVLSCAPAPVDSGAAVAALGADFTVPLRQSRAVADLRAGFDSVVSDSRCKPGRECFWAGDAEVAVSLTDGTGGAVVRMHSNAQFPHTADHGGYHVELVDVDAQGDELTLRVTRSAGR